MLSNLDHNLALRDECKLPPDIHFPVIQQYNSTRSSIYFRSTNTVPLSSKAVIDLITTHLKLDVGELGEDCRSYAMHMIVHGRCIHRLTKYPCINLYTLLFCTPLC